MRTLIGQISVRAVTQASTASPQRNVWIATKTLGAVSALGVASMVASEAQMTVGAVTANIAVEAMIFEGSIKSALTMSSQAGPSRGAMGV